MYRRLLGKLTAACHDRGLGLAAFALLQDALLLILLGLGALLTAESILPGFVTSRFNLSKPIALAAIMIMLLISLRRHLDSISSFTDNKKTRILSAFVFLWVSVLTINALIAFSWWASVVVLALTILILIFLRKALFKR